MQERRYLMVILGMMSYPPEGAKEAGKRFLANPPLPDYLTMKGPFIYASKGEGIRTLVVYECDRSKLADAMEVVSNRYVIYMGVPGLTYTVQVWMEIGEALKMIGM